MFAKKTTDASDGLIEHAAQSADAAIHNTQRVANKAVADLSHSLQGVNHKVREGAYQVGNKTVSYIRKEPVKAVLIAAASGLALMALARMAVNSHPRAQP